MIKILGPRIIGLIVLILLIQGMLGAGVYYYLLPMRADYAQKISTIKGEITQTRAKVAELTVQMARLEGQMVRYVELKDQGFFNAQDRVTARDSIRELAILSHMMKAELRLEKGQIKPDELAQQAGHTLISGPMTLNLESMDDIDIYRFVIALQRGFPGYLEFKKLIIKRKANEMDSLLATISKGGGRTAPLVAGTAELNWWSMASEEQMKANDFFNPASLGAAQVDAAPQATEEGKTP